MVRRYSQFLELVYFLVDILLLNISFLLAMLISFDRISKVTSDRKFAMLLIAVNGSADFWQRQGFEVTQNPQLEAKLRSYGDDAFYMMRAYFLTFEGERSPEAKTPHAHESSWHMTLPLVVLAVLSVVALVHGLPIMKPEGRNTIQTLMENFLDPVFRTTQENLAKRLTNSPLKRIGDPEDIGGIAAFLVMQVSFLLLPFAFYPLLRPAGPAAATAMVALVVVSVPVALVSLSARLDVLSLVTDARAAVTMTPQQLHTEVLLASSRYYNGLTITRLFWGAWLARRIAATP